MVVFWRKQSWQVTDAVLCEADRVVDSAQSGRCYFPCLSWESGRFPHTCLAEQRVRVAWLGRHPVGWQLRPIRRESCCWRCCSVTWSSPSSLSPWPRPRPASLGCSLVWLSHGSVLRRFNYGTGSVSFSLSSSEFAGVSSWLQKLLEMGRIIKAYQRAVTPLWLPSSVMYLFTPASRNSAQRLVLPHQSFFIYAKHHFPSLLPSVFQVSQLWSWAAGRWQHSISWGSWQPAFAWSSTGNGNSEVTRCFALPGRCSASVWCCSQRPAGRICLVMSRTDTGRWA